MREENVSLVVDKTGDRRVRASPGAGAAAGEEWEWGGGVTRRRMLGLWEVPRHVSRCKTRT